MLPLAKPIMATIAIFAAVGQWNSFQDTLILMTKPALYTLQFYCISISIRRALSQP